MKKLLCSLLIALILSPAIPTSYGQEVTPIKRIFRTSAYYSPEPGQSFYAQGSYEAELRMNGQGIAGASGVKVYPGMLAAPKTYAFGTKIKLEGIGIATVWDRGGAIVQAGERGQDYDRIDIWVGSGEEGLKRALSWGKRNVTGYIYPAGTEMTDTLNLASFPIARKNWPTIASDGFSRNLGRGSTGEDVKLLQTKLQTLGYFQGTISGFYGDQTIDAVYDFQKSFALVDNFNSPGAGYFGPQTQKTLDDALENNAPTTTAPAPVTTTIETPPVNETVTITTPTTQTVGTSTATGPGLEFTGKSVEERLVSLEVKTQPSVTKTSPTPLPDGNIILYTEYDRSKPLPAMAPGDQGENVLALQQELIFKGAYNGYLTGVYDTNTKKSVTAYQLQNKLITSTDDFGAGFFGPQTIAHFHSGKAPASVVAKAAPVKAPQQTLSPSDSGDQVKQLQTALLSLQLYNGPLDGMFNAATQQALIQFQLKHKVISDPNAFGAGFYGPLTQSTLSRMLANA